MDLRLGPGNPYYIGRQPILHRQAAGRRFSWEAGKTHLEMSKNPIINSLFSGNWQNTLGNVKNSNYKFAFLGKLAKNIGKRPKLKLKTNFS